MKPIQALSSVALALLLAGAHAQAATTYYVSTTGNDANPGTLAAPWRHINHAASVAAAGATVYVRGGVYNEYVTFAKSGNATAGPIVFQNYAGELPIVDGTGVNCCGGDMRGLFNVNSKSYITINGFEIRNYASGTKNDEPAGIVVIGSGTQIKLLNNKIHDIKTTIEKTGNAHGIAVWGTGTTPYSQITISGNEVYNLKTGQTETVALDGNVTDFSITGNLIHDNSNIGIDVIGFQGTGPDGYDQVRNGTIADNRIYNITTTKNPSYNNEPSAGGIYCDGCANVVIERNLIRNADLGIEVAAETGGEKSSNVTVRNNLVYDTQLANISIGGYDASRGGADRVNVVNNTLYQSASAKGEGFQVQFNTTNSVFKNNIVFLSNAQSGTGGHMVSNVATWTTSPVAFDNNVYFNDAGNATWIWNNKTYTGLGSFVSGAKQDARSKFGNPLFFNLAGRDLRVSANSPAVGAGTNLGASIVGATDFAGAARVIQVIDAGAYER
ncbi:choice-of-anchor Q domain-containing protein [Roseateles chitinivorans]|uniref:choice-of-anchor Q domain-containing protein n=1 Tax=Roseateles chitinivorans TaxID=2917965 RepID=UPI003D665984